MKKFKMTFATLMLGMAIVGGYQAYEYGNMTETGSVLLENVEALANDGDTAKVKCCIDPGDECKLSSGDILEGQDEC